MKERVISYNARDLHFGLTVPFTSTILCVYEKGRLWRDCTYVQAHLCITCSLMQ